MLFEAGGGASGRLAARNLTRHIGRTALTVGGFGVSLSLLIALTAVAIGSAQAGERWTRSLMPGSYAVVSPVDQPPVFISRFETLPTVQHVSPVSFLQTTSRGSPIQLASIEPDVFAPGLEFVAGTPGSAAAALRAGGAAILPNRLAQERGLRLNDEMELTTASGPARLRVAGIVVTSFPSPDGAGSVLISRADGERLFDNRNFRVLSLITGAAESAASVREAVDEMAERYGMSATTPREVAAQVAMALFRLLALFGALVGIGLIIAALGTGNTMLMNIAERQRELSILWAGGMSRRQLQAMAVVEAALMGLMGGLLGAVAGVVLAWVMVALWSTGGFHPEYNVPVAAAVIGVFVAVVASVIAALAPARAAGRLEITL